MTERTSDPTRLHSEDLRAKETFIDKANRLSPEGDSPWDESAWPSLEIRQACITAACNWLGEDLTAFTCKIHGQLAGTVQAPSYTASMHVLREDNATVKPSLGWVRLAIAGGYPTMTAAIAALQAAFTGEKATTAPNESPELKAARAGRAELQACIDDVVSKHPGVDLSSLRKDLAKRDKAIAKLEKASQATNGAILSSHWLVRAVLTTAPSA